MKLLEARDLSAFYGDFQALYGIDFDLDEGEAVALIGANGAGKTTFLKALCGLLQGHHSGDISFQGTPIGSGQTHEIVAKGIALIPEGRHLFPNLSVEENLLLGGYTRRPGLWNLAEIYQLFPGLRQHRMRRATLLSGGQQQMVAIGRALMSNPRVLLCDELSLGLAPVVVKELYRAFPSIRARGVSLVLVEQDIQQALGSTDRMVCLREGRVVLKGRADAYTRDQIASAYFGMRA